MVNEQIDILKGLKARRTTFKSQITRFRKALDTYNETGLLEELKAKTERLVESFNAYNETQSELDAMDDVAGHLDERFEVEDSYIAVLGRARTLILEAEAINSRGSTSSSETASQTRQIQSRPRDENEIQLPRIQLPTFSGSYEDWPGFADQFKATVHDNRQLNDSKRLTYLRSCLTGEAAKTVETLGTSASNYAIAWSMLESRYNKPHVIVNRHLNALFGMSKGLKPSYDEFTRFLNIAESNTKALQARGELTADTILLHLLSTKMDPVTELKWREKTQTRPNLTLSDLFNFVQDQRCLIWPSGHESRPTPKTYPPIKPNGISSARNGPVQTRANDRESRAQPRLALASIAKPRCNICKEEHYTSSCKKLETASIEQRREIVKNAKLCSNCLRPNHIAKDCRSSTCRKCNAKHHTLLHEESRTTSTAAQANVASLCAESSANGLLSTAMVDMIDKNGLPHACRALIDPGSQSHFVSRALAERLQLDQTRVNLPVYGIHNMSKLIPTSTRITIQSRQTDYSTTENFLILDSINHILPARYIDRRTLDIPKKIKLADPHFHKPGPIDLVIGSEIFHELVSTGKIPLANNLCALLNTKLGWIIIGRMQAKFIPAAICNLSTHALDDTLKKFWEIDELPTKKLLSDEEAAAERHYKQHTRRDPNSGKYVVRLPFKEDHTLGDSYATALKRFYSLEKNLMQGTGRKQLYVDFINEYAALGHMSEQKRDNKREGYYLPHHAVFKENSLTTKLRVVFDGSARTKSGKSLNDTLMVGPTIQDQLLSLTIRFRSHAYVLTADITKMYRQTWVHPDDRHYQKILWREHPDQPVKTYSLNTVTYGTSAAPFLAIRSLHQLAEDEADHFPKAAAIFKADFYVDDLLTGARTYHEAESIRDEIMQLAKKGGLELRKWASNDPRLVESSEPRLDNTVVCLDATKTTSILGIHWNPSRDALIYTLKGLKKVKQLTKRTILSQVAQLFDPLGLIGPVVIWARILMQRLWQLRVSWDESVPMDIATAWEGYRDQLPALQDFHVPREILVRDHEQVELHGFCDASERAYGSCVYLKSTNRQGDVAVRLVCSKSRVAPLKTISLPRLELCGAVLLTRLYSAITHALAHIKFDKVYFWTDSTIVLNWINSSPHTLKTFVANRIAEIQSVSVAGQWRHVPSLDNPADIISRSTMPAELKPKPMWYNGPSWLEHSEEEWPANAIFLDEVPEQRPIVACVTSSGTCDLLNRYSSLTKIKRVIAYCRRFAHNSSSKRTQKPTLSGPLSIEELENAMTNIIQIVQHECFTRELTSLVSNGKTKGPIAKLNPFVDSTGTLRVGGRISRSDLPYTTRHPALLPRKHFITELVIREIHKTHYHAGIQATLAAVREQFWVIDGKTAVKRVLHKCVTCLRAKPAILEYKMADLPRDRVTYSRPFSSVGIDYCGPIHIKEKRLRNRNKVKVYIAIFVCLATKAIHIEIVSDLSTEAFIAALRRFFARRGKATHIHSDNATTFVGANREIKELYDMIREQHAHINTTLANEGIKWHFIPPRSPHFGGLWEAAVKSFKRHFTRVIGETLLTYEALHTYTTEIEAILNSRPLTPLSSDPNDLKPLTPAHFLIGGPLTSIPEHDFSETNDSRLSMWEHVQKMKGHFWKRWHKEYLHELTVRRNWHTGQTNDLPIGTLVTLHEDNKSPIRWPLGRITEVHPGEDGVIRVATVKTANGTYKRSIKKLSPLLWADNIAS